MESAWFGNVSIVSKPDDFLVLNFAARPIKYKKQRKGIIHHNIHSFAWFCLSGKETSLPALNTFSLNITFWQGENWDKEKYHKGFRLDQSIP